MDRREFLKSGAAMTMLAVSALSRRESFGEEPPRRKFKMNLNVGQIGVKADPFEAIKLAKEYGYEAVTPMPSYLSEYSESERERLVDEMKAAGLSWGAAGVQPFFVTDETRFNQRKQEILRIAKALQQAGATRCFTWMSPSSDSMTYLENFRQHANRLREVGGILGEHGLRLGLEYIGTRTSAIRGKYPFVRTSAEAKELIGEVGLDNLGIALDSWHWFQAGETREDILKLTNRDVVSVHICDAPASVPREQMPDSPRRLPCATGVIDMKAFLEALVTIGYEGPVETEPFDRSLSRMTTDEAMSTATAAMKKAFSLIE